MAAQAAQEEAMQAWVPVLSARPALDLQELLRLVSSPAAEAHSRAE
jgi:hypothetical protein